MTCDWRPEGLETIEDGLESATEDDLAAILDGKFFFLSFLLAQQIDPLSIIHPLKQGPLRLGTSQ